MSSTANQFWSPSASIRPRCETAHRDRPRGAGVARVIVVHSPRHIHAVGSGTAVGTANGDVVDAAGRRIEKDPGVRTSAVVIVRGVFDQIAARVVDAHQVGVAQRASNHRRAEDIELYVVSASSVTLNQSTSRLVSISAGRPRQTAAG